MTTVGECRICGTGPLGLRRCGVCRRVVVLCDECDSAWPTTDTSGKPTYSRDEEMPCPWCAASLLGNGASWVVDLDAE